MHKTTSSFIPCCLLSGHEGKSSKNELLRMKVKIKKLNMMAMLIEPKEVKLEMHISVGNNKVREPFVCEGQTVQFAIWYLELFERDYPQKEKEMLVTVNNLIEWWLILRGSHFLMLIKCVGNRFFMRQVYLRLRHHY